MHAETWLRGGGPVYVGLLAASTISVVMLFAYTAMKLAGISFEPVVDSTTLAVVAIFAGVSAFMLSERGANGD